jgi:probable F420-dependent oxidoreductase
VRIGVALPHYGSEASLERIVDIASGCEGLGFDSVWVSDHLMFDLAKYGGTDEPLGSLEPMTTLAVLARQTRRVRLGTMVLCNEFRHPVQLAKEAAAVDLASGGRLELGLGAGWYEREFTAAGLRFPPASERLARLGEAVEILKLVFDGAPVSFEWAHYALRDVLVAPRPAQRPRPTIWVGGKGDRAIAMIAKVADGWNAAWFQDVEPYLERASLLGDAAVRRSIGQYARGSAQEMTDRLATFADAGVEHAIMCFSEVPFGLDDTDDLARFAQDVLPHVREL